MPLMPSPAEGGGWSKVPVPVGSAALVAGIPHSGKDRYLLIYSWDSMSGHLREMSAMIEEIRAGRFLPDVSRRKVAGTWNPQMQLRWSDISFRDAFTLSKMSLERARSVVV